MQHGDNGLLVPFDDNEAFRATAQRLAGQLPWVRAMGAQARLTACRLDWGRIVEQVESVSAAAIALPLPAGRAVWLPALP